MPAAERISLFVLLFCLAKTVGSLQSNICSDERDERRF